MMTKIENKKMPSVGEKKAKVTVMNNSGVTLHGVAPGEKVEIEVDSHGTPKSKEWRRRLKDSKVDGCISIVTKTKK